MGLIVSHKGHKGELLLLNQVKQKVILLISWCNRLRSNLIKMVHLARTTILWLPQIQHLVKATRIWILMISSLSNRNDHHSINSTKLRAQSQKKSRRKLQRDLKSHQDSSLWLLKCSKAWTRFSLADQPTMPLPQLMKQSKNLSIWQQST